MGLTYRKIQVGIWDDPEFMASSDTTKLVFLHTLTNPFTTAFGLYHAGIAALAENSRMDTDVYKASFQECIDKGWLEYDDFYHLVFIPNFFKFNRASNPNIISGWISNLSLMPESPLKYKTILLLGEYARYWGKDDLIRMRWEREAVPLLEESPIPEHSRVRQTLQDRVYETLNQNPVEDPYRAVHTKIWQDAEFIEASIDQRLVFLHILTGPHAESCGCFRSGVAALAESCGMDFEQYKTAFEGCLRRSFKGLGNPTRKGLGNPSRKGFRNGWFLYDKTYRVVLVPNVIRYNPPTSIKMISAWRKRIGALPESDLKYECVRILDAHSYDWGTSGKLRQHWEKEFSDLLKKLKESTQNPRVTETQESRVTETQEGRVTETHPGRVTETTKQEPPISSYSSNTHSSRGGARVADATKKAKEPKRSKIFVPPTEAEVVDFFVSKGYPAELGARTFEYYSVADWRDKNGYPVKSWKQKMIANWMKPELKAVTGEAGSWEAKNAAGFFSHIESLIREGRDISNSDPIAHDTLAMELLERLGGIEGLIKGEEQDPGFTLKARLVFIRDYTTISLKNAETKG